MSPGVDTALEILRKIVHDLIKLYRHPVRRFEGQTQALAGRAEDVLWANKVEKYFAIRVPRLGSVLG